MPPLLRLSLFLALLVGLSALPVDAQLLPGGAASAAEAPATQPGTLVFKLRPEYLAQASPDRVALPALEATLRRLGATRLRQKFPHTLPPSTEKPGSVDLRLVYQVWFDKSAPLDKARFALLRTGLLAYAEPLHYRAPLHQPNDPLADSTATGGQYHLKNIRAYKAWDLTQGDTTLVIGVTDTGFRLSHEDMAGQWQRNYQDPPDGIDNDNDGYVDNYRGWDLADDDNDPAVGVMPLATHGVNTSGLAAGRTGNGVGIAGVGFKCRFLPLKIYPNTPNGTFGGYEAIVYAADHGCQVINMSWGGPGGRSQFEQDVVSYAAINRNTVLVSAGGNTNAELDFYPASYDHVLSVGASDGSDLKAGFGTYSRRIDLLAPGFRVVSTGGDSDQHYTFGTGSSFAAPQVAGAAALVRVRFPQLNAAQVIAQLRRTTDPVDQLAGNLPYAGKLGTGRLNVYRAVRANDQRSARVVQSQYSPAKAAYQPNDTIRLAVTVQNLLQPVQNLTVTLSSLSPYVTVRQGAFGVGSLATLAQAGNAAAPFRMAVAASVPLNTRAVLRYHFSDPATGYEEDQYATLLLNPDYVVLNVGDLALTLTSRGNLGYDGLGSDIGEGISYRHGSPLLYEGGLMLATSPARVSSRIRNDKGNTDASFFSLAQAAVRRLPLRADQEATGMLRDSLPGPGQIHSVGVQVRQRGYAWAQPPHRDYVVLEYQLKNITADTLKPLYAGLFADWDINEYGRNVVAWDSVRRLSYVYDQGAPLQYVGLKWLRGGAPACYALDVNASASSPVHLFDGFSRAEKFLTLSSGTRQRTTGLPNGTDIAHVLGAVLPKLAPNDSATVAFAVLAAPSLAQLQAAADAAQVRYAQVLPVRPALAAGTWQLYPNPTTGQLQLEVPASFGATSVWVLNPLGQVIMQRSAIGTAINLDLRGVAAGVYVVQVQGTGGTASRRVLVQP